ncbi:MAG: molybdopterin-binding protein [Thermodesulfobacteriota bacterium]
MEIDLLEKTELWIENITLDGTDLNRLAAAAAEVLRIDPAKVLVVDVGETHLTLDILQNRLEAEHVFGKKAELLQSLARLPGVRITGATEIHSDGILGLIALEEGAAREVLEKSSALAAEVSARVARRACVFPTGFEVKRGLIQDANTPYIQAVLETRGFQVTRGDVLDDDQDFIAGRIRRAIEAGFGLVITTGGVGAEAKDRTVEAVLKIDPEARTPYIVRFTKGAGRHVKDGVRIAVGQAGRAMIVALPGPNDEVRAGMPVLMEGLEKGWGREELAAGLVQVLRTRLGRYPQSSIGEKHGC